MGYALLKEKAPLGQKVEDLGLHLGNVALSHCCVRGKSAANDNLASGSVLPGQYFDEETNLHYNYFRDYDPSVGRYVQSDPIGILGGLNTYNYVGNSPANFIDPDGQRPIGGGPPQQDFSPCQYYNQIANSNGCNYHRNAFNICRGQNVFVNTLVGLCFITIPELNCIRRCLVEADKRAMQDPNCITDPDGCGSGPCTRSSCIDNYHNTCFESCGVSSLCYGGNYAPYPNDGD